MAQNGLGIIQPINGVMNGLNPLGLASGYLVGANIPGAAGEPWITGKPFKDLLKMSLGWSVRTAGNFTLDNQDRVVSIDSGTVLEKLTVLGENGDSQVPPAGNYRVRFSGGAQVAVGNGASETQYAAYNSSGEFTVSLPSSADIYFYVTGPGALNTLECVHVDDVADFDAGNPWRDAWFNAQANLGLSIIRYLRTAFWCTDISQLTTPAAISYTGDRHGTTFLHNDNGSHTLTVPWSLMADLANRLGTHLAINIPVLGGDAMVAEIGRIVSTNLNTSRLNFAEIGNESWNQADPYREIGFAVGSASLPKLSVTLIPGSNVVTAPGHNFSEGERFRAFFNPASDVRPVWPSPWQTHTSILRAVNVVAGTSFEAVLDSDGTTPANADTDVTAAFVVRIQDIGSDDVTIEMIDHGHGQEAVRLWDLYKSQNVNAQNVRECMSTQQGWRARTDDRVGPNGSNGRYDFITPGCYWNINDTYTAGDDNAAMYAKGVVSVDNVLAQFDDLIANGYAADQIWCHEGGQHNVGVDAEMTTAFLNFSRSAEQGTLNLRLHQGLADRGVYGGCSVPGAVFQWGDSGSWSAYEYESQTLHPRNQIIADFNGVIPPTS